MRGTALQVGKLRVQRGLAILDAINQGRQPFDVRLHGRKGCGEMLQLGHYRGDIGGL